MHDTRASDVPFDAGTTRRCTDCNELETPGRRLKKCGGCSDSDVVYCSVACQRKAWPNHSMTCRSGNAVVLARAPMDDTWDRLPPDRSDLGNDSLRRCSECHQPQTVGTKLKKCRACTTLYCSSECQKKAWPKHKATCIPDAEVQPEVIRVGKGQMSFHTFTQDLSDFVHAHSYAFRTIAYSMSLLHCQANREVDPDSRELPRLLRFQIRHIPSPDTRGSYNPASRFVLGKQSFGDIDESIRASPSLWKRADAVREEADRSFSLCPQGHYAAPLAVEYYVPEADVSGMIEWFPLGEPLPNPPHDPATTSVALNDLINVCVNSINLGFPLRVTKTGDIYPRPGRFMRSGKNWKFEELFPDWDCYQPGQHRALDYAHSQIKSGRSIPMLFLFLFSEMGVVTEDVHREAYRRMGVPEALIPPLP